MTTRDMSEAEAIERAKKGDVSGYEALYKLHKRTVYALCLRWTGNQSDAEDFTQEVFLQVYRKIGNFRGDAKLGTWLYRVTVNLIKMEGRRKKHRASIVTLPEGIDFRVPRCDPAIVAHPLEQVALNRAIDDLSAARRNVVLLHDVRGYTHREAAGCLGLAVGTIKSNLSKAHKSLRSVLWRAPSRTRIQAAGTNEGR